MGWALVIVIVVVVVIAFSGGSSSTNGREPETDKAAIDAIKDRQADEYVRAWQAGVMTAADRDAAISKIRSVGTKTPGPSRPDR